MAVEQAVLTEQLQAEIEKQASTIFYRYCSRGGSVQLDEEDLKSIGIVGALEVAERFDPEKGNWPAFAKRRAWGAMLDKVRKMALVSMGQDGYEKVKLLESARHELMVNNHQPTCQVLAEHLGWSVDDVDKWSALRPVLVPVAEGDAFEDDENSVSGMVLLSREIGPEKANLRLEARQMVDDCIDRLPSSELRLILVGRILHGVKLKELAESFDCAIQTILNKQKKAVAWMRQCIKAKGWPDEGWDNLFAGEGDS